MTAQTMKRLLKQYSPDTCDISLKFYNKTYWDFTVWTNTHQITWELANN